jgi:ferric-dicitrate binding protein FerR (iron transport regulator)
MSDRDQRASAALAAARLTQPVRGLTRLDVDEWTVRRMWENIQRRSTGHGALAPVRSRRHGVTALVLSVGLVLVVTLAVGASWLLLRGSAERSLTANSALPLLTKDGHRFETLEAAEGTRPALVAFADGSSIEALPGARVEGLAATGSEFVVLVRQGRAHFSVTPGGPRRWLIETKSARVEVVGTVLSVENGADFVEVRVDKGVVLVRSPLLNDGVQRVQAGQSLRLQTPTPVPPREAAPRPHEAPREPAPTAAAPVKSAQPAQPLTRHRRGTSAAELWNGADQARQSGDAARAAALLERLLDEHPGDSQAALGAYTLGVLLLEQLARPRAAAQRFAQALDLGLATGLVESCYVRRAEALRQAGAANELRRVASEYLHRFPAGAQREAMQRLLEGNAPASGPARTPGSP